MKRFVFMPMALMSLAGSLAFAQTDYTGYSDDEEAAFAELERETQGTEAPAAIADDGNAQEASVQEASAPAGSSWELPPQNMPAENSGYTVDATVKETTPVATAPATPREETWEECWQKRRFNVSFYIGFFPVTSIGDIFIDILDGEDDKDPDLTAYSVSVGYELFYLLELGLMVDYTTVAQSPVIAVIPRVKLNWLNFKYVRLYSYAGLGGIFFDSGGTIMFNFAVLGLEVGYHVSLFFEGGWGQVGLLTLGAKIAF